MKLQRMYMEDFWGTHCYRTFAEYTSSKLMGTFNWNTESKGYAQVHEIRSSELEAMLITTWERYITKNAVEVGTSI